MVPHGQLFRRVHGRPHCGGHERRDDQPLGPRKAHGVPPAGAARLHEAPLRGGERPPLQPKRRLAPPLGVGGSGLGGSDPRAGSPGHAEAALRARAGPGGRQAHGRSEPRGVEHPGAAHFGVRGGERRSARVGPAPKEVVVRAPRRQEGQHLRLVLEPRGGLAAGDGHGGRQQPGDQHVGPALLHHHAAGPAAGPHARHFEHVVVPLRHEFAAELWQGQQDVCVGPVRAAPRV
mmetsp:Transcript_27282/g.49594  ORF Transcript_27282/g.49594 Transcript_27282/m.49594 type:complete len:233 (+) Transcript_27282:302-1000(+)